MSEFDDGEDRLGDIYARRFSDADAREKDLIWREVARFLQRFVDGGDVVVDIACDRGDFIRNIVAREKWATDIRDVPAPLPDGVRFVKADGLHLDRVLPRGHFDVAFMSNYLEHLGSNRDVIDQLGVVHRILRPGGLVMILQPNIRLVGGRYWDFIDHSVALTERSLVEAATLSGFTTEKLITRFLPYTTKSRLPHSPMIVRAYLSAPFLWWVFGKQTLFVGRTDATSGG